MSERPIKKFPIEGFPDFIQNFIFTCKDVYESPWDFWSGAVITSTALAIGDKIELVTKYEDVPILWTCMVGDVSSGKTTPLSICMKFFESEDSKAIGTYRREKKDYDQQMRRNPQSMGPKPACFQYILKDATPEAMADVHANNSRGLIYYRDELKGWIDDFGRYNKSGEEANMLSSFTRIPMTINRKSNGEIMNIAKPFISVTGGMQPDLLKGLAKDNRAENGFMSRFCFIFPDVAQKPQYSNAEIPEELIDAYCQYLEKLTALKETTRINLGREAKKEYEAWYNYNAKCINEASNGYLKGVYGKFDIISLRLAIVVRGMRYASEDVSLEEDITPGEIKTALHITEYFRETAHKVYEKIFGCDEHSRLSKPDVARFIYNTLKYSNKTRIAEVLKTSRLQINRILKE